MKKTIRKALSVVLALTLLFTALALSPPRAEAANVVSGSFPAVAGMDIATVRYLYEQDGQSVYGFADLVYSAEGVSYSFSAPTDGFTAVEASNLAPVEGATVLAEYFSVTKWDGAVDVSWYNETDATLYISTPAQLAGLAAIVNGSVDGNTPDYRIKGDRELIESEFIAEGSLAAGGTGPVHKGLAKHDFADRTVVLTADLDMGGAPGAEIVHTGYNDAANQYGYPNWMPIGGQFLADVDDTDTMVHAFFNGVFDGGGHRIENLYCYRWNPKADSAGNNNVFCYSQGVGLFGAFGTLYEGEPTPAVDPTIRNVSLSGYVYGRRMVGGLVGYTGGGKNSVEYECVNGIYIENCANHAFVYNTDSKGIAGIIATAMVYDGAVINCYNTGDLSTVYANPMGGIVASNEGLDIYNCYNTGTLDSHGNSRGRGIGGNADAGANYTVDDCYYLTGCGDDAVYPGYYTANAAPSVKVTTTAVTTAQIEDGTLTELLNSNGGAYVQSGARPVLAWEVYGLSSADVTLAQPEGGTVTASASGTVTAPKVVYLTCSEETGWAFRSFTLNGKALTGRHATVTGDSTLSASLKAVQAGVLNIAPNAYCEISVVKTGTALVGEELTPVENYPVRAGDPLYEGDVLTVTATLKEGAVPENEDMIFSAAVGLNNPYTFTYTYVGTDNEPVTRMLNTYTVTGDISGEGVSLLLEVTPLETKKLWRHVSDTSWYDSTQTTFTLTTARELAGLQSLVLAGNTFSGKTVLLGADISLVNDDGTSGRRFWDGVGNATYFFSGTFDGQGHKITDLHGSSYGLFAYVYGSAGSRASIRNVSVYGESEGSAACGIVSYAQYTDVSSCSSFVDVTSNAACAAGIVGTERGYSAVSGCFNYGEIVGVGQVGGLVGSLSETGSLTDSFSSGNVSCLTVGNYNTGGIVGSLSGALLRCGSTGDVLSRGRNTGGIAGQSVNKAAAITDCYSAGDVIYDGGTNTLDSLGGVIGFASYYKVTNSFHYGAVTKRSGSLGTNIGGVFGRDGARSDNTTENVRFFGGENDPAVASKSVASLGSYTYWAGIDRADAAGFADPDVVLAAINGNGSFILTGAYPQLSYESGSVHIHSGGTASCVNRAVCAVCGLEYGEIDPDNHMHTYLASRREPAWTSDGSTGDTMCEDCGKMVLAGDPIPADTTKHAFTVTVVCEGETLTTKEYTIAEFDAIAATETIAYQFGSSLMVTDRYVTVAALLDDVSAPLDRLLQVTARGEGIQGTLTAEKMETDRYYFDSSGKRYDAPASIAIHWGSGAGDMETLLRTAAKLGELRFGYGVSEENKDTAAGNRLISPVTSLTVTIAPEKEGSAVSGTITGYEGKGTVSVILTKDDQTVDTATVTSNTSYTFDAVADGTYTLTVSADGDYVAHSYTLTVSGKDVTLDVTIRLLGDLNEDGIRSSADVTALGRHVAKLSKITDEYILLLCDTTGDGVITSADVTHLGRFAAKLINKL